MLKNMVPGLNWAGPGMNLTMLGLALGFQLAELWAFNQPICKVTISRYGQSRNSPCLVEACVNVVLAQPKVAQ